MKRSYINLIVSALLLGFGWFIPHSVFDVTLETPTPTPSTAPPTESTAPEMPGIPVTTELPSPTQSLAPVSDPYGELYFTLWSHIEYSPPEEPPQGIIETTSRMVRLPGSCVVGLEACPAPEAVETPFQAKDIFATDSTLLTWSPDGRYGLLLTHPEDELSAGKTNEELDVLRNQSPSEFEVNPSTLYMFDAQLNTWQVVYRAERKFFFSPTWSPDGKWIAFQVLSSNWTFHPWQAGDGIYIVRPDGSELQQLSAVHNTFILGWIGNSLLIRQLNDIQRSSDHTIESLAETIEMLTLDGEIKPLFEATREVLYSLAPDGGALLVAEALGEFPGSPTKSVDVLALDGTVAHTFGTFRSYNFSIYPLTWSRDGSMVAFPSMQRVYVGPRGGQDDSLSGIAGVSPYGPVREVYYANETQTQPSFEGLQFSTDSKYLLIQVYDGLQRFVTVALDAGQAIPLDLLEVEGDEQPGLFSWRQ